MTQLFYHSWLQHLHKTGTYIPCRRAVVIGAALLIAFAVYLIGFLLPMIAEVTPQQPSLFLVLLCAIAPPMFRQMQRIVRELSTSKDQLKKLDKKRAG